MTKAEEDLAKVYASIKATRFLGLSVISLDVDILTRALDERYEKGLRRDK